MIKQAVYIFLICLTNCLSALAQKTSGSLEVTKYHKDITVQQLFRNINLSNNDTNKVKLMLKLVSIYWYNATDKYLDTCIMFADNARKLSEKLGYNNGRNEALLLLCKSLAERNYISQATALVKDVYGEERVRLLLILSEHFVFAADSTKNSLQTAYPIMQRALALSDSIHSVPWKFQCQVLFGKYYFIRGDFEKGKNLFLQIIREYQRRRDPANEAHYWSELEQYLPETDSTYHYLIYCNQKAFKLFNQIHNYADATYSLRENVYIDLDFNKIDSAEKEIQEVLSRLNSLKIKPKFETYWLTANVYYCKGNFHKSLSYTLMAIEAAQNEHDKMEGYQLLGYTYSSLGSAKCLPYLKQVFEYFTSSNAAFMYEVCYYQALAQIRFGRAETSLHTLLNFKQAHPAVRPNDKVYLAAAFGNTFNALHNYQKAEEFYLEMIADEKKVEQEKKKIITTAGEISQSEPYYDMGRFYTERKRFSEAKPYLIKSLNAVFEPTVERKSDAEFLLFRVDSALGKYPSAIQHFERHKAINDSMFNISRSRQIEEIQIKYETIQKDQSIKLLESNHRIDRTELRTIGLQRNLTLGGISALLIISGLIYNRYRLKQRSNRLLEVQQKEIELQNFSLQNLVTEKNELISQKDDLLVEKDLLLKEVNHRVKNNLQMIMSLLESQSAYLDSEAAQLAITESQNRVQALALIHQKLYHAGNVTDVNMEEYISELVTYLNNSYSTNEKAILIKHSVDNINLDVSLAIPLGLILNESITNAIKHAFQGRRNGEIFVSLKCVQKHHLKLSVTDDGVGLFSKPEQKNSGSLGMILIKGLTRQLGGVFEIENKNGLTIIVEFPVHAMIKNQFVVS